MRERLADIATLADIAVICASIANVGIVVFAAIQLILLRGQLKAAKESANASRDAAQAAESTVTESVRSRADEHAPRVVALMEPPQWPPLIDRNRSRMPGGGELRLLHPDSISRSSNSLPEAPFVFERDSQIFIWFRMRGVLVNEGSGTARVRLDGESHFLKGTSSLLADKGEIDVPPSVGAPNQNEHLLRPGDMALFEWASGHSAEEWSLAYPYSDPPNPKGACVFTITVFDFFEHGITDYINIVMAARPLIPVSGASGQWKLPQKVEDSSIGMTVYPTQRRYHLESSTPPSPQWLETYKNE